MSELDDGQPWQLVVNEKNKGHHRSNTAPIQPIATTAEPTRGRRKSRGRRNARHKGNTNTESQPSQEFGSSRPHREPKFPRMISPNVRDIVTTPAWAPDTNTVAGGATITISKRYRRHHGTNSDIRIDHLGVARTQHLYTITENISYGIREDHTDLFTDKTYSFAAEFSKMDPETRLNFFKDTYVEFVVNSSCVCILTASGTFPKPSLLIQLEALGDGMKEIQHLIVRIQVPDIEDVKGRIGRIAQADDGTILAPVNRAYPFLAVLVGKIRTYKSLRTLDVLVELRCPYVPTKENDDRHFLDVVLPFYKLDRAHFSIKTISPDVHPPVKMDLESLKLLDKRSAKLKKAHGEVMRIAREKDAADAKARANSFTVKYSKVPGVESRSYL